MAAQSSNPSHLLISRNPRSPAHPQLASTTTSLYSPQPGPHLFSFGSSSASASDSADPAHGIVAHVPLHTRSHSTPAFSMTAEDDMYEDDEDEEEEDIVVHPTFTQDAALPGRVKVIVGRHEFWCHKEVLWFASPFFNALLQGSWAETSSVVVAAQPSSPTDTDPAHGPERSVTSSTDVPEPNTAESTVVPGRVSERSSAAFAALKGVGSPRASKRSSRQSRRSIGLESESDADLNKTSVYLDALDDGPSVAQILKELRELPEPPASGAFDTIAGTGNAPPPPQTGTTTTTSTAMTPVPESPKEPETPAAPSQAPVPVAAASQAPTATSSTPPERPRSAPTISSPSATHVAPLRLQPSVGHTCPPAVTMATTSDARHPWRLSNGFDPSVPAFPVRKEDRTDERIDAVVELHEESPAAFQDFLFWAYPHLECKVTWTNVESLLALSSKLDVPALQSLCERFLVTHASGRPFVALMLAEQYYNADLYREASRFVLDQSTWDEHEMATLSDQTQLKLSMRRNWFLERLLKLGSIDCKKEYTCRHDCPDPSRCQAQLDEKWRQAHQAVSRYGPPQPSVAFRCLRQLETFPTNPSLVMPHPLCQSAAKSWVTTLFDRMFQPKLVFGALSPGTEKYWLYITLPR